MTPDRYADMLLQIVQGYAPDAKAQQKVSEMKWAMEAEGCSDNFIVKAFAGTLVDGLAHGNWPWTEPPVDQSLTEQRAARPSERAKATMSLKLTGHAVPPKVPDRHDYEPGEYVAPMQTDPSCRVCGQIKRSKVHA